MEGVQGFVFARVVCGLRIFGILSFLGPQISTVRVAGEQKNVHLCVKTSADRMAPKGCAKQGSKSKKKRMNF